MPGSPDDLRHWSLDLSPRLVPRAGGRRPRESRPPPPTAGSSAIRHPTPALSLGSGALGLAVAPVDGLAPQSHHRSARDGPRLAPPRLPALLALEGQGRLSRPPEA